MTPKQTAFVGEYLVDLNATRAATRAGYSARTAYSHGQRLLKDVDVQAALQAGMNDRAARTEITADNVLRELAKIGFGNMRDLFTSDGHLKRIEDLDPGVSAMIQSIEVVVKNGDGSATTEQTAKIKLWDKLAALDKMGRHLGLFAEGAAKSNDYPQSVSVEFVSSAETFDRRMRCALGLVPGVEGTEEGLAYRAQREAEVLKETARRITRRAVIASKIEAV